MSNSLLTDSIILKETMMSLKNNLSFCRNVTTEYSDQFAKSGAKVGATINIRKPTRYNVTTGATLTVQDSADQSVALTADKHYHVGMAFAEVDRTLSIDKFRERYVDPAAIALANTIDYNFASAMYQSVFSSVGVPSATAFPSTLKGFVNAKAVASSLGAPKGVYSAIVDPLVEASLVEGLKGLFQSSERIAEQYEMGEMGLAAGCKFSMSQNVPKHTAGAPAGAPAIKTTIAADNTSTIALDGITGSITACYKVGDVITIQNVYAVNPQTKQSTGQLAQFVVTATTNSVTNEIASLPISPAIYGPGSAYQNVDAYPVDGALVYLFGAALTYASVVAPQNMVFHKSAFALASVDFELPSEGVKATRVVDKEAGLSLTMTRQFDITNYRNITRIDFLGGWKCIYPELACRVVGQPA
jgi:hypothetical protein